MLTPERWTKNIERAVMLYLESNYDVHLTVGLQQIQESPGFKENLRMYVELDPIGKARWERLKPAIVEVESRTVVAQRATGTIIVWTEWLTIDPATSAQATPPSEAVRNWMRRMERAVELYQLSDYDRLITEYHRAKRTDTQFQIQMTRFTMQDSMGAARWQRITSMTNRIEWKRIQAWQEIQRLNQNRKSQQS
jgi:hypothetical protein